MSAEEYVACDHEWVDAGSRVDLAGETISRDFECRRCSWPLRVPSGVSIEDAWARDMRTSGLVLDPGRWVEGECYDGWSICTDDIPVWESDVTLWPPPGHDGRATGWTLQSTGAQPVTAEDFDRAAAIIRWHEEAKNDG